MFGSGLRPPAENPPVSRSKISEEIFNVVFRRVPTAHQPAIALADVGVKLPAAPAQLVDLRLWDACENGVRLTWKSNFHIWNQAKTLLQLPRHFVGVSGVAKPRAVLQDSNPRRGKKTHLRSELPRLFTSVIKFLRQLCVEKNHRFSDRQSIFRSAKTEDIHAGLPGDLFR